MTAIEHMKAMLANALERCCILEEQIEIRDARIAELNTALAEKKK